MNIKQTPSRPSNQTNAVLRRIIDSQLAFIAWLSALFGLSVCLSVKIERCFTNIGLVWIWIITRSEGWGIPFTLPSTHSRLFGRSLFMFFAQPFHFMWHAMCALIWMMHKLANFVYSLLHLQQASGYLFSGKQSVCSQVKQGEVKASES